MKLKGRRNETVSDIQGESQAVLNSIRENDVHGAFEAWEKDWIAVHVPEKAILKEMAAKIKFSQHFFFYLVWELSVSTSKKTHFLCSPCRGFIMRTSSSAESCSCEK
jgi:hypothetical protein